MRTTWTVLTGVAAIAPILSMVAIPILWKDEPSANYEAARAHAEAFSYLVMGLMAVSYVVTGFFIVLAFRSKAVPSAKRGLWAALLFFGNALVIPFFWYWYIWRANDNSDGVTAST
jgi:uncharacterized membrane protein (DUF485 family)